MKNYFDKWISILNEYFKGKLKIIFFSQIGCSIVFLYIQFANPLFTKYIFDAIDNEKLAGLYSLVGIFFIIMVVAVLSGIILLVFEEAWRMVVSYKATKDVYKKLFTLPQYILNEKYSEGEIYNRITNGPMETLDLIITINACFFMLLSAVVIAATLIQVSFWYVFLIATLLIVEFIRNIIENKKKSEYQEKIRTVSACCEQSMNFMLSNIEQLVMTKTDEIIFKDWDKNRQMCWRYEWKKIFLALAFDDITDVLYIIAYVVLFSSISILFGAGEIGLGIVTSSYAFLFRFRNLITSTRFMTTGISSILVSVNRLFDLMSITDTNKMSRVSDAAVCFDKVSVKASGKSILNAVSFTIEDGEKIAVIGKNGSGKSSVLKTILGIYQVTSGNVNVYGNVNYDSDYLLCRSLFSYLPVEIHLFSQSVEENIRMSMSDSDVLLLPEKDVIHHKIAELSGGQARRVSICRALSHHSKILIADEPTSGLDANLVEEYIVKIISHQGTKIVVTHDEKLLHYFDKVMIVDNGSLIEFKRYDEIVKTQAYQNWLK